MSDDWVKHYIQDRTNKQRRTDMAVSGALSVFQKIQDRIKQDIQAFHDNGLFPSLQVGREVPSGSFSVSASEPLPRGGLMLRLDTVLNTVLISYVYALDRPRSGSLKVCSDLDGTLQVYRDGELFAVESDMSEVSEFLLRPLLTYVDTR